MQKTTLFGNSTQSGISPSHARLEKIKALTRDYIESHNGLVGLLWDLELAISSEENYKRKEILLTLYDEVKTQYESAKSVDNIESLLQKIEALDMELKGSSTIGSSPYSL
ncbi:hypothetical protein [Legionella yabuuchiae]|uniref:hypothetical protein n=1 Tax=Legionella yabuuchiae TaxID=376727 RepID=UPI0010557B0C|nr:hypothetical protein [Legionella yabuuchiae]